MQAPFAFELIATGDEAGARLGQRFEVKTAFSIGRDAANDLVLRETNLSRHHCRFVVKNLRLYLEELRSENGLTFNGKSQHGTTTLLHPGDCIGLPGGFVLRVSGAPLLALDANDPLMKAVEEAPHDEGRWRVWADVQLEAGNPLGERLALGHGRDSTKDAHALTTLNDAVATGELAVDWRHGFMRRAVLRNMSPWQSTASWDRLLRRVVVHPLAHFLEELEVDALSFGQRVDRSGLQQVEGLIADSLEALSSSAKLPVLEVFRFGPIPQPVWNPRITTAWRHCAQTLPKLAPQSGPIWVARAAWLQLLSTPISVAVSGLEVGAQRRLKAEQANLIGPTTGLSFSMTAPEGSRTSQVGVRVDREHGLWWVTDIVAETQRMWHRTDDEGLRVNGRACIRHRLRPGDVLELAPGLTFKFVMME